MIKKQSVSILIDSRSTHNFVNDRVACRLGFPIEDGDTFDVLIGDGTHLKSCGVCSQVELELQDYNFLLDFYLLPTKGVDVVLGVQWLKALGSVK